MNLDAAPTRSYPRGDYEEYHPYGSTAWWAGSSATVSQKRYRFTGMERDDETGLQCHGVRYYAVWLGRWVSADPIGLGDGVNRFGYCHGGVVQWVDSSGLSTEDEVVASLRSSDEEAFRGIGEEEARLWAQAYLHPTSVARWDALADRIGDELSTSQTGASVQRLALARYGSMTASLAADDYASAAASGVLAAVEHAGSPAFGESLSGTFARVALNLAGGAALSAGSKALLGTLARTAGLWFSRLDEALSSSGSGLPTTGVAYLDDLAVNAKFYERWKQAMVRRGVEVVDKPIADPDLYGAVRVQGGKIQVLIDPTRTTVLTLLHETRHVAQLRRAGLTQNPNTLTLAWFERGAWTYQARVVRAMGGASAAADFAGRRASDYWNFAMQRRVLMSKSTREYIESLWN